MKSPTSRFSDCRGFTLIELMIAAIIIGVVSAMAVPSFQRAYDRHTFKAGEKMVTSTLKKARSTAISKKAPHGVHFDPMALTVTLFENKLNPAAAAFEVGDSALTVDTLPVEYEYVFTDFPEDAIVFQANGSALLTGYGNIYLTGETDGMMAYISINILASTGRINSYGHYYAW